MQFCKGDAAKILYRCQKCSSVAFRGVTIREAHQSNPSALIRERELCFSFALVFFHRWVL
jgi:hypothetical protein